MLEMSSPAMNAMYMPTCLFCFQRQLLLSEPLLACFTFPMQGEHSLPKVHMRVGFMRTQRKIVTCVVSISVVHLKPPFICVCVCVLVCFCVPKVHSICFMAFILYITRVNLDQPACCASVLYQSASVCPCFFDRRRFCSYQG